MNENIIALIADLREKETLAAVSALLDAGEDPVKILRSCSSAMEMVGDRFEKGVYYLPQLMMAGEILRQVSDMVKPIIKVDIDSHRKGKVLIGTVKGDIHFIGKDIVIFLLDINGFKVKDLGVDVSPGKFISEIAEFQPAVVGMSGLLTPAYDSMKNTIDTIQSAGMRNKVKIIIGGGQVSENVRDYTGADAYGKDAVEGVTLIKKWLEDCL
jgi:methanogenic corrinoid protein MtbC1